MRTRVKICGITRPEDGFAAAQLGADAIGLVFYAPSPRCVNYEQARAVCVALPPFVSVVGLFVDPAAEAVRTALAGVPLDVLQFHGSEPAEFCRGFALPWLKAIPMRADTDLAVAARDYTGAAGLLLDTPGEALPGGTGKAFDWSLIPQGLAVPLILAGGLTPDNVGAAIAVARPYAVDVSSGVEAAKGIKDAGKMAAFIREVERASINIQNP
jgi:phosphoribosylanthranilate isomerase